MVIGIATHLWLHECGACCGLRRHHIASEEANSEARFLSAYDVAQGTEDSRIVPRLYSKPWVKHICVGYVSLWADVMRAGVKELEITNMGL